MAAMKLKAVEHTVLSINDKLTFCLKSGQLLFCILAVQLFAELTEYNFK